ncbi:MAG TPA: cysteine--tRNA ligase [Candidatus Paceibacterota bacterium]|nr:cysteine--tRNA ligase [Candidatus Paceibacterota bacterium]
MDIRLFNTYSGTKEEFTPLSRGSVGMYHCGPTVYNYAHIGNLRAYVFADTIRRTFEFAGYKVKQVVNITDVGHLTSDADTGKDKIEERARTENKSASEIANFYTEAFFKNLKDLNVNTAGTLFPKASEHIKEQIDLIRRLEEKGFTYKTSDGIYFDTAKFKDYGKLGHVDLAGQVEGARVEINSEKRHPTDFALWKFSQPYEKRLQEWESPWGVGFPGWHIECSAMSMKYLGETFDIHTGGIDHIPVHHNNEIAQSVCATGKEFARYWMHSAFVQVRGEKMAKSKNNFLTLDGLAEEGVSPLAYRYWLLTSHYRTPVNFTDEAAENAGTTLEKLKRFIGKAKMGGAPLPEWIAKFERLIGDDFDTPGAIALMWKLIRNRSEKEEDKRATVLEFDKVLGLGLAELPQKTVSQRVPKEVKDLLKKRESARAEKDFASSDSLRDEIARLGYRVMDTPDGQVVEALPR